MCFFYYAGCELWRFAQTLLQASQISSTSAWVITTLAPCNHQAKSSWHYESCCGRLLWLGTRIFQMAVTDFCQVC